jgi:hypothetical protein
MSVCKGVAVCCRKPKYDLDAMEGAWKKSLPLLGNVLELLTPNFHRKASSSSLVLNLARQHFACTSTTAPGAAAAGADNLYQQQCKGSRGATLPGIPQAAVSWWLCLREMWLKVHADCSPVCCAELCVCFHLRSSWSGVMSMVESTGVLRHSWTLWSARAGPHYCQHTQCYVCRAVAAALEQATETERT